MRVAFLVADGEPADLPVAALRDRHGIDVQVLADHDASAAPFDLAIAGGWRSARRLEAIDAPRHALRLVEMEDRRHAPDSPERTAAAAAQELPIDLIVPARWMAEQLATIRPPGKPGTIHHVPVAVDTTVFTIPEQSEPRPDGAPLRIAVAAGAPADPHDGLPEALAALAQLREPAHVTLLGDAAAPRDARVDTVTGPLDDPQLADHLGRADVLLHTARLAGLPRLPLLALHRGATCVSTPVTGHDEVLTDGHDALLTSWDDPRGTARLLDLLARDRALLQRLRDNALDTARAWPSSEQAADRLASVLHQIADAA